MLERTALLAQCQGAGVVAAGSSASGSHVSGQSSGRSVGVLISGVIMTRMTSSLRMMLSHQIAQMTACKAAVMTRRSSGSGGGSPDSSSRCHRGA